jgi:hypothetical protein
MDYVIETDFEGPGFVAVPNHVIDRDDLSPEALGVLVWMARRPRGYIIRATAVQSHFRMGRDRWQRIARELRAAGALRNHRLRDLETGRMAGEAAVIGWPAEKAKPKAKTRATTPGAGKPGIRADHREPENPASGPENPAQVSRKTRPPIKDPHSAAREASPASQSGAGGAGPKAIRARGPEAPGTTEAAEPTAGRCCDGWRRAGLAAEMGQRWRHPESGDWHEPQTFEALAPASARQDRPARSPLRSDLN